MEHYLNIFIFTTAFGVIALSAHQIGRFFVRANLPLITGFLFSGIIAGPFVLGLIPEEAVGELRFVDEISLAFIAFAAGSELYLKDLRGRIGGIIWITIGLVVFTFGLTFLAVTFLLADFIPFLQDVSVTGRVAVALLAAAILVARSPSAAIAVINELRAKGPFSKVVLSVTVIMDVVVIILFALNSSAADALLTGLSFDIGFVGLLLAELLLSAGVGYLLAKILELIISRRMHYLLKIGLILLSGFCVFLFSEQIRQFTHNNLPFEVLLEPLLICMIGSLILTNASQHRLEFLTIIHDSGLPIYVAFFTLTGASLELDVLAQTWPIALALFGVRLVGIFLGSFFGGIIAGEPMSHNRIRWLAFITQAGVALGLAKEVAVEFPEFGGAFATMIISLVVLNEMGGPIFLKWTIKRVGEAHTRAEPGEFDGTRDAIIFGLEGQGLALADQLRSHGWQVRIAAREKRLAEEEVTDVDPIIYSFSEVNLELLHKMEANKAEAIVTLLSDEENYRICELAYEHFGTKDLVVRLNDRANFERFHELGALIVYPATAIVSLLDHLVRSPSAASLLLGREEGQDIVDLEVRDPNLHGVALRDLRIPLDTLVLSVHRDGRLLISHGYTRLKFGDRVTVVGSEESLDEVMLYLDG